ncbi:MAG TPA: hypothetical protein VN612_13730 [Acidobacteriaceae bacterium]|nr:hypothetical protein [Acidobacteriaceae bacterium]
MAIFTLALWLQQSDLALTNRLIMILIGLIVLAALCLGIVLIVVAVKAVKVLRDFGAAAEEFKGKMLPLLDVAAEVGRTSRDLLTDAAPKIKVITTNFVETSESLKETSKTAKAVVQHCDTTIADANMRAQRQVARVDGMVTAALNTTAEVVEAIGHGLKAPAQRIAILAGQARNLAEGFFAKLRARRAAAGAEPLEETEEPPYV